ncbi:MAG: GNAT family N-acetyltransferase [Gemmatimonadota bacterium]|nr:GNAT family N-acetyltransferase [Gemmatimonadota bacterium]
MSSPAIIRRARASDAPAISSLIHQHVASGTLLPRAPEFVAEHAIDFLVATVDGRVVGCVHLDEYSPSLAEVRSIVVDAAYQRRGVGVALLKAIEGLARTREYRTLFAVSNNDAFFRSRGYLPREIPELSRERSEVTRFKGVYAKDLADVSSSR